MKISPLMLAGSAALMVLLKVIGGAAELTEKNAIVIALQNNTGIKLLHIADSIDSLNLESARSAWYPQGAIAVDPSYTFRDTSWTNPGFPDTALSTGQNNPSYGGTINLGLSQAFMGGATLNVAIGNGGAHVLSTSATSYTSTYSLALNQPLLKNAWRNGPIDYEIRIASLDHERFTLGQKKDLYAALADIRGDYWTFYEKRVVLKVIENQLDLSRSRLDHERRRFSLGEIAETDTLQDALEVLQFEQSLLTAQADEETARNDLAQALLMDPDSVDLPPDIDIKVDEPPAAERFSLEILKNDPQMKIFWVMRNELDEQLDNAHNNLLPQLDLGIGYTYNGAGNGVFGSDLSISGASSVGLHLSYAVPASNNRIALRRHQLESRSQELTSLQYHLDIKKQTRQMYDDWKKEKQQVELLLLSQVIAGKNFDASRKSFDLGTIDKLSLLKAQYALAEIAINLVQAQIALKRLEIKYDQMTGNALRRFGASLR